MDINKNPDIFDINSSDFGVIPLSEDKKDFAESDSSGREEIPLSNEHKDLTDNTKDYVSGDATRSSSGHKFRTKDT